MARAFPQNFYTPLAYDDWSQHIFITLNTESNALQTVLYKLRDTFKFKVGAGLTIKNIIFDATDSSIDLATDFSIQLNCS